MCKLPKFNFVFKMPDCGDLCNLPDFCDLSDFGKFLKDLNPNIELLNANKQNEFISRGNGGRNYTMEQKNYAMNLIQEHGIRGTCRILGLPRRTLQRWCRQYNIIVNRCPDWVYERAERMKNRKKRYR